MAENDDDFRPGFDFTVVNGKLHLESIRPAIHRGSDNIDEQSDTAVTGTDALTLRTTTSQTTFDTVLAGYWQNWPNRKARWGAGLRLAIQAPTWPT